MSEQLVLRAAEISETALVLPEDMAQEDWLVVGEQLGRIGRAHQWWVGDWLCYGEKRYGETYAAAKAATGLDYETLVALKRISGRIENRRRRRFVSWSHHQEVAALEPAEQDRWLNWAATPDENDRRPTRQELRREMRRARELVPPDPPQGKYRCIVIDPPWPVEKIEREIRPNQVKHLDYRTMTLEEIADLPIAEYADTNCHVYLWVTHKLLPTGLDILAGWGAAYECSLTWVKPVGMTPFSWMYNSEHVLFARIGALPLIQQGVKLAFDAPIAGHSTKPDEFYKRVQLVSPGPRLEMYARGTHEGFEAWGNEVADAA